MRIISGKFKGRRIKISKNLPIRPTTNLAKESIFNIISNKIDFNSLKVLDLFTGSGMIGLEFISRGSDVTFVENNIKCVKHVSNTLNILSLNSKIINKDVFKYLINCDDKYDLIFADPPYSLKIENYEKLIKLSTENTLKNSNGLFILEHYKKNDFSQHYNFFEMRSYGDCSFTFFKQKSG
ncbi:MAG: 16S rRNA (guanine(966)-N(2))-methyltransferase RsmD [Flavobacteriaceae bacterium]|nr:16S rRNA (guanine(966)-N(2))-methyltransferase RsmD [Flavobacteriaceae bacterium]OUV87222.1 MAG: hypothetical protein CBD05_00855 [Flavobacteriaceae bacterium TMED145]|tara:strand:- start:30480 stop:31022 length:543 start_codon:yes stop_codon:yes gene_type:complete